MYCYCWRSGPEQALWLWGCLSVWHVGCWLLVWEGEERKIRTWRSQDDACCMLQKRLGFKRQAEGSFLSSVHFWCTYVQSLHPKSSAPATKNHVDHISPIWSGLLNRFSVHALVKLVTATCSADQISNNEQEDRWTPWCDHWVNYGFQIRGYLCDRGITRCAAVHILRRRKNKRRRKINKGTRQRKITSTGGSISKTAHYLESSLYACYCFDS